jgi:surface antigen
MPLTLSDKIIIAAQKYIGQYEKKNNSGFYSRDFEKKMESVGWSPTQSWCAYFAELAWKDGFAGHPLLKTLDRLFSGSATATFANFSASKLFKTGATPKLGALVVWRFGNDWRGHIGIVTSIDGKGGFKSVEGNTNQAGGREGVAVLEKYRKTKEPFKAKGLNIVGFVYLP